MMEVNLQWKFTCDRSISVMEVHRVIKVYLCSRLTCDQRLPVVKVYLSWRFTCDQSLPVMEVIKVYLSWRFTSDQSESVMAVYSLWRFTCDGSKKQITLDISIHIVEGSGLERRAG